MKKEYLMSAITIICWSTLPPMTKLLLQELSNMDVLFFSSAIAALFLCFILIVTGKWRLVLTYKISDMFQLVVLGFVGNFLYSILYYNGLATLTSRDACIINYLWPIITVLFSCIFLKERPSAKKILAILISFSGVFLIATKGNGIAEISPDNAGGIISCILAAICYGAFNVLNKLKGKDQFINMTIYFFTTAFCSGICYFISGHVVVLHNAQIIGIIWLGIFIDAIAFLLWALALQNSEASFLANFSYATPVLSMIFSIVFLHEAIDFYSIIGLVLILSSFFLQFY